MKTIGSTSYLTDHDGNISQFVCYTPYGETLVDEHLTGVDPVLHNGTYVTKYLFNGKELDNETNMYYYGARYFEPREILWYGCDPLREKYPFTSSYVYCNANPVKYVDPDGEEPNKAYAGTIDDFVNFANNIPTQIGHAKNEEASNAMLRMGEMKITITGPKPKSTAPFNMCKGRYIYTKKAGWIDMSHFMFYAGRAFKYKTEGEQFPRGKALEDGLLQEIADMFFASHSACSYEDLTSDKMGAIFGAEFFDPNSELSLGEQLQSFFTTYLNAAKPEDAPNYSTMPNTDTQSKPSQTNLSSQPLYCTENETE